MELREALIYGNAEQCEEIYQSLLSNIVLCENSLSKCEYIENAQNLQSKMMEEMLQQKDKELESLQYQVEQLKQEYERLNVDKQNKEQYEVVIKLINEHPSREKTEKEISSIETQISELESENERISEKFENKSKQFQLLLYALNTLQSEIEKEEKSLQQNMMDTSSDK